MSDDRTSVLTRRSFIGAAGLGALGAVASGPAVGSYLAWSQRYASSFRTQALPTRLFLSGINWIADDPPGIRLRWFYPLMVPGGALYSGFPDKFLIERANVNVDGTYPGHSESGEVGSHPRCPYPRNWWRAGFSQVSVAPATFRPATSSVQAITFIYSGPSTVVEVRDSAECALGQFEITNGNRFYFEGADISSVAFLSDNGQNMSLSDAHYLDLFHVNYNFQWVRVAEIAVRRPLVDPPSGTFDRISSRLYDRPKIAQPDWDEIRTHAQQADRIKQPADDTTTDVMPTWDTWLALTGFRWEIATLSGFGFIDGPTRVPRVVGDVVNTPTAGPPGTHLAYRVKADPDNNTFGYSNVILVCPGTAAPLAPPAETRYENASVELVQPVVDGDIRLAPRVAYAGKTNLRWRHTDAWAIGVRAHEVISRSPVKPDRPGMELTTELRANSYAGMDLAGNSLRDFSLPFPDSTVTALLVSVDPWDRESGPRNIPTTRFDFAHAPVPPPLACAIRDRGAQNVKIERLVTNAQPSLGCMEMTGKYQEWIADEAVLGLGGHLEIARRVKLPLEADTVVTRVVNLSGAAYTVSVATPLPAQITNGARLIQGRIHATILNVATDRSTLTVRLEPEHSGEPSDGGSASGPECPPSHRLPAATAVFSNGPAVAIQNSASPDLWKRLSVARVDPPPPLFDLRDDTASTGLIDVVSYSVRVGFNSLDGTIRFGPYGNPVTALDKQDPPTKPPPFELVILGRDYYGRLVISAKFTGVPAEGSFFQVAWAEGAATEWAEAGGQGHPSFASKRTIGIIGKQKTHRQKQLFDVLEAPDPHFSDVVLTIGINAIDSIGQESPYSLVELIVPAA